MGIENLEPLIGEWTMEATPPDGPPWPGEGRLSFEWLDGNTWVVQRWSVDLPEAPNGIAIFGIKDASPSGENVDTSGNAFEQHYFDSRGVHRVFEMTLEDGKWTLWRDDPDPFPQRMVAEFSEDGKTITGAWEKQEDGEWTVDFNVTYTKVA